MILIAVLILAGFQPGFLFPQMAVGRKQRKAIAAAAAAARDDGEGRSNVSSGNEKDAPVV